MTPDFNFRHYVPGDEKQIIDLLVHVFDGWPRCDLTCSKIDYWKWKFSDYPKKINLTIVAEIDNKIIGVTHGILLDVKIGDKIFTCHKGADVAVHPDYRGMGVYTKLNTIAHENYDKHGNCFGYSLTSNPYLIKRLKKPGSEHHLFPSPIMYLLRVKNIEEHLKYEKRVSFPVPEQFLKIGIKGIKFIKKMRKSNRIIHRQTDFRIIKISEFNTGFNEFWKAIRNNYSFVVEKNSEYLNWRYADHRGGKYTSWVAKDEDRILGYLVIKINSLYREYPIGYIMEVIALDNRIDVVDSLLKKAIEYFDQYNINSTYSQIVRGHSYGDLLKRYNFIDTRKKPYLTYHIKDIGEEINSFTSATPEMIHYQYGESDSI